MNRFGEFVRTTIIGGLLGVAPILVVYLLLSEALDVSLSVVEPVAEALPISEIAGIEVPLLVAITGILLACFATGLILSTAPGKATFGWIERAFLLRIPGYGLTKSLTLGLGSMREDGAYEAVLLRLAENGAGAMGLLVETLEDGRMTVFVPAAPTPGVGFVYVAEESQVERLGVEGRIALQCVMQFGIGAREVLAGPPD